MNICKADIVLSTAGRDQGHMFFVLETDGAYAYLINGKSRKLENPKRKKIRHLRFVDRTELPSAEKLRNGLEVLNRELRRDLAIYGTQFNSQNQGG